MTMLFLSALHTVLKMHNIYAIVVCYKNNDIYIFFGVSIHVLNVVFISLKILAKPFITARDDISKQRKTNALNKLCIVGVATILFLFIFARFVLEASKACGSHLGGFVSFLSVFNEVIMTVMLRLCQP